MFKQKEPVSRRRDPTKLKAPTKKDLRKYQDTLDYYEDKDKCTNWEYWEQSESET